jgi:PKD repeat protein
MKKQLFIIFGFIIFLSSCKSPNAEFYIDKTEAEVGEDIIFKNLSERAYRYEWDMGDGFTSEEEDIIRPYLAAGTYTVSLTAYCKKKNETATRTVLIKNVNEKFVGNYLFSSSCNESYTTNIEAIGIDKIKIKNFANKGYDVEAFVTKSAFEATNYTVVNNGLTYYVSVSGNFTFNQIIFTYTIGSIPSTGEQCTDIALKL